jgi:hypothetical protein
MFLRLVADSFTRRPKRKMLTMAALALGMAVATAALSVSLDVGDRLAQEFRSLGANLLVTPEADSLPLEIGGVDYRPANAGAYLPVEDLGKLKMVVPWKLQVILPSSEPGPTNAFPSLTEQLTRLAYPKPTRGGMSKGSGSTTVPGNVSSGPRLRRDLGC